LPSPSGGCPAPLESVPAPSVATRLNWWCSARRAAQEPRRRRGAQGERERLLVRRGGLGVPGRHCDRLDRARTQCRARNRARCQVGPARGSPASRRRRWPPPADANGAQWAGAVSVGMRLGVAACVCVGARVRGVDCSHLWALARQGFTVVVEDEAVLLGGFAFRTDTPSLCATPCKFVVNGRVS